MAYPGSGRATEAGRFGGRRRPHEIARLRPGRSRARDRVTGARRSLCAPGDRHARCLDCHPPSRRKNRGAGRTSCGTRGYETVHQHVGLVAVPGTQVRICHRRLTRNFREAGPCLLTVFGSYEESDDKVADPVPSGPAWVIFDVRRAPTPPSGLRRSPGAMPQPPRPWRDGRRQAMPRPAPHPPPSVAAPRAPRVAGPSPPPTARGAARRAAVPASRSCSRLRRRRRRPGWTPWRAPYSASSAARTCP